MVMCSLYKNDARDILIGRCHLGEVSPFSGKMVAKLPVQDQMVEMKSVNSVRLFLKEMEGGISLWYLWVG